MTIDELVSKFNPCENEVYVSVNNPRIRGVETPGNTIIDSAEIEFENNETNIYVTIKKGEE